MAQSTPIQGDVMFRLRAEFDTEAKRLVEAERARTSVEGILRLRALSDIAAQLSTEGLVELAAAVAIVKSDGLSARQVRPRPPAASRRERPLQ